MKHVGLLSLLFGCALAGAVLAVVLAGATPASVFTTSTASTTTTTVTEPVAVIPEGVTVAGVDVGGMTADAAFVVVRAAFEAPLVLTLDGRSLAPTPASLGAIAYVQSAVIRARTAPVGTDVPLVVRVQGARVRAYVKKLARRFDRSAVETRLVLRRLRPFLTKERVGRRIDRPAVTKAIVDALVANDRFPVALKVAPVRPRVTRKTFGPIVVIRRESKRLFLYSGMQFRKRFGVATGQPSYPTPLGRFSIVVKWRNPWWYPPSSDWARGQKPIPPGPGNPLGTRWMGLSAPGVGIHGTPDPASIGYSASHGCIRMVISDAEWLFQHVSIGTPVFIVAA